MKKKLYIKTFGCQMNEYDSKQMTDLMADARQYEEVKSPEQADLILVNTCSIREKAQEKLFSELGRWRELKNKNPQLLIGVGGCVASQEGEDIWRRAPYVDVVFGPQTLHRLPELVDSAQQTQQSVIDITFPEIEKFDRLPEAKADGVTAFVSIMEGCSKYCSFCVVPYTRGEEFSRPFDDVIAEVIALAEQGVREVTLLGQNVNAYRGMMQDGKIADLAVLIQFVATIEGIDRIRYTTSHPVEFSDRLIDAYAEVPELVSQVHLPVQSGSDRILAAMKRGHTSLEYLSKIRRLRSVRPDISISSDFIVGFPGETQQDFDQTMKLIEKVDFDNAFSFVYSARPGTPAASLDDEVTAAEKKHRLAILQRRINEQTQEKSKAMQGTQQRVLVTGKSKKTPDDMSGRTENNRVVNFPGDESLVGQFMNIEITEILPNSLRGRLLHDNEPLAEVAGA
ncbi:MAG: tRNA (N6-isopentenyl adenosine(37)-C2)-methylthiotransferase MiaB [Pseudomonadota bacterium]